MKKLLFAICVLASASAYSQSMMPFRVSNIAALKAYYGASLDVHVIDRNEDYVRCDTCTPDEVFIFDGVGTRNWKLTPTPFILRNAGGSGYAIMKIASVSEAVEKRLKGSTYVALDSTTNDSSITISATGLQPTLVSGTNIKTINSTSLLGSGNITISGGGGSDTAISVRRLASIPSTGNIYIDSATNRIRYKSGNYWYRVAIQDSIIVDEGGGFGSELITNGGFSADANWTKGTGVTITGGEAVATSVAAFAYILIQDIAIVNTKTYRIEFDATNYTAGSFEVILGDFSASVNSSAYTANGHYSVDLTVNDPAIPAKISFISLGSGASVHIDNVTVKEVL